MTKGRSASARAGIAVVLLDALHELHASLAALDVLEEQGGGEVRHSLGEEVPSRALAGSQEVAPSLVGALVSRDQEDGVGLDVALGEEADPSEKVMSVGNPWA